MKDLSIGSHMQAQSAMWLIAFFAIIPDENLLERLVAET
jgi:hypothetical protein